MKTTKIGYFVLPLKSQSVWSWVSKRAQNPTSARLHENADLRPRHDAQHGKLQPYHKKGYFILQTKWGGGRMEELANGLMHKTTTSALVELRHSTEAELTWTGSIFPSKQMNYNQIIMNQVVGQRLQRMTNHNRFYSTVLRQQMSKWGYYSYSDELV